MPLVTKVIFKRAHKKRAQGHSTRKLGLHGKHKDYVKMIRHKKCARGHMSSKLGSPDGHEGYVKTRRPEKCAQGHLGRKLGRLDGHECCDKMMIRPKKCAQGVLTRNLGVRDWLEGFGEMMRIYHKNSQKHADLCLKITDLTLELERLRPKIHGAQVNTSKIKELKEAWTAVFERHKKVAVCIEKFTFRRLL